VVESRSVLKVCLKSAASSAQPLTLVFAGFIYAIALKYFVIPAQVILTGTEGLAVATGYFFENDNIFLVLYGIFQAILLTFAAFKIGRGFALRSFIAVVTVLTGVAFLPDFAFAQPESYNERIILVLFGGIVAGVGKAIAFRARGSVGDEDILGAFFAMKYRRPVGAVAIIAGVISTAYGLSLALIKTGGFEAVINTLMYTSIFIFVSAETLNNLFRKFEVTVVTVFTKNPDLIGQAIKKVSAHRTFTVEEGRGGHSNENFSVVQTIITHEELKETLKAIKATDAGCFYYYHDIEGTSQNYYIKPIA